MSFSENAILTKSRAIYAKRLTDRNYKELLGCSSIAEAANYLATKTHYSEVFSDVTSAKINRMMIESLLKRCLLNRLLSLCHFSKILGNELYQYIVIKNDITAILSCLRHMETPNKYDFLISLPVFLDKITSVDMMKLAKTENFEQVLNELSHTPYQSILEKFKNEKIDMIKIENALNDFMYKKTYEIAKKKLSKKEFEEVIGLFRMNADLKFISNIFRLKKYFNMSAQKIKEYDFDVKVTALDRKQIEAMISAENVNEMYEIIDKTVYGKKLNCRKFERFEDWTLQYKHNEMSHKAIYSTAPNVVMVCCNFLAEIEIKNITNIIQGIKYQIPEADIEKNLIGYQNLKKGG